MKTAFALSLIIGVTAFAQNTLEPPSGKGENPKLTVEAKGYFTREAATAALGMDPGENIVVVEVKVTPKPGETFRLDLDEFLLRADNDGQRAKPLSPTQIAGTSVMVVSSRGGAQGDLMHEQRRTSYGIPGIPRRPGQQGPPPTLPDPTASTTGAATANTSEATASIEEKKGTKEQNVLLETLKKRQLLDGEISGPVSGLLYFPFEGKHKTKHFELVYSKWPPRASVRFTEPDKKKK